MPAIVERPAITWPIRGERGCDAGPPTELLPYLRCSWLAGLDQALVSQSGDEDWPSGRGPP